VIEENRSDILWRITNQFLFTEILAELPTVFQSYNLSVVVSLHFAAFNVNIGTKTISATGYFSIATSHTNPNAVLEIGTVIGQVDIDLLQNSLIQTVNTPQLRIIFDEHINAAALAMGIHKSHATTQSSRLTVVPEDLIQKLRGVFASRVVAEWIHSDL